MKGNGLYVGKFLAYHKGHQNCINKFSLMSDKLNLILCTNSVKDKVPGLIRLNWLKNDIKSGYINTKGNIKLFVLNEDDIPPYPIGIKQWCKAVEDLIQDKIDVMYGNDSYVKECADIFGCDYLIPDIDREEYSISSTKILENKLEYYDLLTEASKPYFNKSILITGAESTGKSSLAKRLAWHFKGGYVEEFGRSYEEETMRRFNRSAFNWNEKDYYDVAVTHNEFISQAMEKPDKLVFVDTDAIVTEVYYEKYLNKEDELVKGLIARQSFDLIIFLESLDTKWVGDGIRVYSDHKERNDIEDRIKKKLNEWKKEYVVIKNSGGYEERFEEVKKLIVNKFNIN